MSGDSAKAERVVRTTCPRDCYDACGIAAVERADGTLKILGDRSHPVSRGALCGKCALAYNGVFRDRHARLAHPLRRAGPKGSGRFRRVSWGEALAEIAQRLHAIVREAGAQRIFHTHYTGTCSLLAGEFPMRFFHRLGATEVEPDTICNNAGHAALDYVYGTSGVGFDPKTAAHSRCIVVWGANPSHSAPHMHKHWLRETPARVIAIDPIRHETAAQAHLHLQPYPGTDAALAFALMHVARRDGLIDRAFIRARVLGWEELEPLVEPCTPRWGERVSGVPAALIEEAAALYARGPSLLWLGQGLQRQPRGGNVVRACAALPAITGNLCKPGAGFAYVNGAGSRNIDERYLTAPHLRRDPASSVSHMELAECLADRERAQALVSWNMNVAASGPRQGALRAALARKDLFTVVIDLFQTDTADFADLVLPAASFLEFDDLVVPYFYLYVSAQAKVEDPPGEALPNQEIFRRLARAMGYSEPELYEPDRAIIETLLARTGLDIDFDTLRARGTVDPWHEPRVQFESGRFPTPSGRIELACAAAAADGHPRTPEPYADPRPRDGWLRLLSPASRWQLNDSYGNDPHIHKARGEPTLHLNPDDLRALGLEPGGCCELANDAGRLVLRVAPSDAVPHGVALSHKGAWPKLAAQGANVNALNPGRPTDLGASTSVHGTEVRITPHPGP